MEMHNLSTMYEIVNCLCKEKGINITIMCKELEISRTSLSELKSGRTKTLSSEVLQKIAKYFDVSVDYILGETEQKEKPVTESDAELVEYLEELRTRPEMRMMFSLAKGATKKDVEKAVKVIETMFNKD